MRPSALSKPGKRQHEDTKTRAGARARCLLLRVFVSSWLILSPSLEWASAAEGEIVKLGDGVYARIVEPDSSAVGNAGFVLLDGGVLVFDTHFTPEAGQALAAEIRKVTDAPVRYLVNSHFHPDHTHGNLAFAGPELAAPPDILGSGQTRRAVLQKDLPAMNRSLAVAAAQLEKLRKDLAATRDAAAQTALRAQIGSRQAFLDRMGGLRILAPLVAVDDTLEIGSHKGPVELRYIGRGHTDGDLVLVVASARVAFTGDLFYNDALPASQDAFLLDWIPTLDELLKLDVETFVPGHGRPGTRQDVRRFLKYLGDLKALVEPSVTKGTPVEAVVRETALPAEYSEFKFRNFFPANVQKMFLELKAAAPPPAPPPQSGKKPTAPRPL